MAVDRRGAALIAAVAALLAFSVAPAARAERPGDRLILSGLADFPSGWTAQGGELRPADLYELVKEPQGPSLRSIDRPETVRIFKKIGWDSAAYPIIEWTWRVKKWPADETAQVALYVSLDTDIFGIPTILKYTWSRARPEGSVEEGGMFRPVETVVQSGRSESSEWVTERIDVRAEFERHIGRAPKGAAYGIGWLADPGVVVEVGEITAVAR